MSSTITTFADVLKDVYSDSFLRADGTWVTAKELRERAAALATEPPPQPEPLVEDEAPIVVEAAPHGYTRGDLARMRKVEQLRGDLDRGLK